MATGVSRRVRTLEVHDTNFLQKEPRPHPYGGKVSRLRRFLRRRLAACPTPWTSRRSRTKLPSASCLNNVPSPWLLPPQRSRHRVPTTRCSRPASCPPHHSCHLLAPRSRHRVRLQRTSKFQPHLCLDVVLTSTDVESLPSSCAPVLLAPRTTRPTQCRSRLGSLRLSCLVLVLILPMCPPHH